MSEALFQSAHQALTFALNFSSSLYEPPVMNRMAQDAPPPPGRGLGGLDGAAQAGMIRAALARMPLIEADALVARIAPRWFPCDCLSPCCSGKKTNPDWKLAVTTLVLASQDIVKADRALREALVIKHFTGGVKVTDVADETGYHRDTVAKHNRKLSEEFKAIESRAWNRIEEMLISTGVCASVD